MKQEQNTRQIARLIREQKLSAKELMRKHLAQIEKWNDKIFALRSYDKEGAERGAAQADEILQQGKRVGRLHGIPFCVKDHINVAGLPRSEGTKHHSEEKCSSNASVVERFLAEGALCIGKSNMSQYGKSYATENQDFGRTSNPFDLKRTPGGSSGGDSAAVASAMVQFAIGADSGGSVRVPASFCGCFGLSPTPGRISNAGLSEFSHSVRTVFRNIGLFARSVHDLELLAQIACGFDSRDPYSTPLPNSLALESVKFSPADLSRSFVYFDEIDGIQCAEEVSEALSSAVASLEKIGFQGRNETPQMVTDAFEPFIVLSVQAGLQSEDIAAELRGTPRDPTQESPGLKILRKRLQEELPELTAAAVLRYWIEVDRLRYEAAAFFQKCDFLLCPVSATLAPVHGATEYEVRGRKLQNQEAFRFASVPNVLGLPAVAFPTGLSSDGLPIGLQIIGPRFSERRLIQIVREMGYENSLIAPELLG